MSKYIIGDIELLGRHLAELSYWDRIEGGISQVKKICKDNYGMNIVIPLEDKETDTQLLFLSDGERIILVPRGTYIGDDKKRKMDIRTDIDLYGHISLWERIIHRKNKTYKKHKKAVKEAVKEMKSIGHKGTHFGVFRATKSIAPKIIEAILTYKLAKLPFWVFGHSLGGGIASYLPFYICHIYHIDDSRFEVIRTWGALKVFKRRMAKLFGKKYGKSFKRFWIDRDIVPHTPIAWSHPKPYRNSFYINSKFKIFGRWGSLTEIGRWRTNFKEMLDDHSIDSNSKDAYAEAMNRNYIKDNSFMPLV